jgi:arylsulfatase A-like enzyme/HEAT repeat protein
MPPLLTSGVLAGSLLGLVVSTLGVSNRSPVTIAATVAVLGAAGLLIGVAQLAFKIATRTVARLVPLARGRVMGLALAATLLATPAVILTAQSLLSGRQARSLPGHPALVVLAALLLAIGTMGLAGVTVWLAARTSQARPRWIASLAILLLCSAGAMFALDRIWLVRRYDVIHALLAAAGFLLLQAAIAVAYRPRRQPYPSWSQRLGPALVAACGALGAIHLNTPGGADLRRNLVGAGVLGERLLDLALRAQSPPAGRAAAPTIVQPLPTPVTSGTAPLAGADVILVTVDALRADHLGLQGYHRATSPSLDRLARRAAVFEQAYAPAPHTSFSLTSLLTGRHAWSLSQAGKLDGLPTLADAFREAGYLTIGVFPPAVFYVQEELFVGQQKRRFGFQDVHFASIEDPRDAVVRTDHAIARLEASHGHSVFMWIHYFGPHEPYVHDPANGEPAFGGRDVDRYDEEILNVDRQLGRLFEYLDRKRPGAVVVVSADHGEEFGEHGGSYHGTSLYDEQLRVPLIVALPGGHARRVAEPVSTVDIAPTLLGLTGVRWSAPLDGADLTAAMDGHRQPSRVAFAELEGLKMVRRGRHKLLCDVSRDFCRLYDLVTDPGEHRDIAPRAPRLRDELRGVLLGWLGRGTPVDDNGDASELSVAQALLERAARFDADAVSRLPDLLEPAPNGGLFPWKQRQRAAELMARLPHPRKRASLASALARDPDPGVRTWAAIGLALDGRRDVMAYLTNVVPDSGDHTLRAYRALALAAGGSKQAVPDLIAVLPSVTDAAIRCELARALGASADVAGLSALQEAYPVVRSRVCVARALGLLRTPLALPFLGQRLRDEPYSHVRAALVEAIAVNGGKKAVPALLELFRSETEEVVIASAARRLVELGAGLPVGGKRRVAVPPRARELWLVPSGKVGASLRVGLQDPGGRRVTTRIPATDKREAYALVLPARPPLQRPTRASGPRGHALFR